MTRPSTRDHMAAYVFFLAAALLMTWPLVTVLSTHFAGYPFGDAHEMTRHIWWFKYAIQHGQPLIFQPLLGYPDGMQGVILWSDPLQFFPAWLFAFVMPLPAAYNLHCLLNLALNGWAAYFLVWKLTEDRFAALVAGLIFMAAPMMQGHLAGGHGGLLVQWPLPLLAYSLIRLRQTTIQPPDFPTTNNFGVFSRLSLSTRYSALSTFFFILLPLGHTLQLIYAGLPLIGVFGLTMLVKREWRALARLVTVVLIGSAILALFLLPVLGSTFDTQAYTDEGGGVAFSLDLLGIVTPSFNHPLYGQLPYTRQVLGVNLVEGSSYIGLFAGLLALIALWKKPAARWWLLLAGVAWILALGPLLKIFDTPINASTDEYSTFITLPWALVADLPGFNLARTPGRFGFVLALAVAVMAGYGAQWLSAVSRQPSAKNEAAVAKKFTPRFLRIPHTSYFSTIPLRFPLSPQSLVLSTFFLLLLLFDYQSYWPLPTYAAAIPAAVHELAERDDIRAVFDLPWDNVLAAKDALWLQTAHEKPLIAGQVTRKTPVSPAKLTILEQTLDPALLNEAGADVIILHKQYDSEGILAATARKTLGEPFYQDDMLALWDVPEVVANPELTFTQSSPSLADMYVYVPESGWINFQGQIVADNPDLQLLLNDQLFLSSSGEGQTLVDVWLPFDRAGYHTFSIRPALPCPQFLSDSTFTCASPYIRFSSLSPLLPDAFQTPVVYDGGVSLKASLLIPQVQPPGSLTLLGTFWWQFDSAITDQDVRFIKIIDQDGTQVAGVDAPLGNYQAGTMHYDRWQLEKSDLAPGTYRVCVGWYSHPDLTRFPILSDVDGAQDGLACIGEFMISAP